MTRRPVAFFKLTPEDFEDLDTTVERIMRMIEERCRERHQGEDRDGAHGRREPHEPGEPISIPLADENTPDPPQDR